MKRWTTDADRAAHWDNLLRDLRSRAGPEQTPQSIVARENAARKRAEKEAAGE